MRKLIARFWKEEAGSPILEAAVVLPFVLILGLGAIEFGFALYQYQMAAAGLRTAARYLARIPQASWSSTVPGDSRNFTYTQYAQALAVIDPVTASPRVAGWSMSAVQVTSRATNNCVLVQSTCTNPLRGPTTIYTVVLSTNFTATGLGFTRLLGLSGPVRISMEHEERVIGQ